ncbi:putative polyketide hydroxylase [Fusarium oxysporum f. sp. albedinis]|nr:putative polyketide hydroxylase [Fusarium oxysporum f. sp. albedinis]
MHVCRYTLANFMIVINTRASSTKTLARYGQRPITAELLARSRPFDLLSCHSDFSDCHVPEGKLADEDWAKQKS